MNRKSRARGPTSGSTEVWGNALHNEVPGISIPDAVRARMKSAGDSALRVGIEMAQGLLREVRRCYAGAYLVPSFGRFEVVAEVLDVLR